MWSPAGLLVFSGLSGVLLAVVGEAHGHLRLGATGHLHLRKPRRLRSHAARGHHRKQPHALLALHEELHLQKPAEELDENMTVVEAKARVPAKVRFLFEESAAASHGNAEKAKAAQTALGLVFNQARADLDQKELACKDSQDRLTKLTKQTLKEFNKVDAQRKTAAARMDSLQTGNERTLAELEAVRAQYREHRKLCTHVRTTVASGTANLTADATLAKKIKTDITGSCNSGGGTPPPMTECSLNDGTLSMMFKDAAKRTEVAQLSGASEKLLSQALERAAFRYLPRKTDDFLLQRSKRMRRRGGRHQHWRVKRLALRKLLMSKQLPSYMCADAPVPKCEGLADELDSFVGGVDDLIDSMSAGADQADEQCQQSLASYNAQALELSRQASDAGEMLANIDQEKRVVDIQWKQKRTELRAVKVEVSQKVLACASKMYDLDGILCATRKLHNVVLKGGMGDLNWLGYCKVSDWVRHPCNATCAGGWQNITRDVIWRKTPTAPCPKLHVMNRCNEHLCPVHAQVGPWGDWSECSRNCDGGTRLRSRSVTSPASNGGNPPPETSEIAVCNKIPCNLNCDLAPWTEWSSCSKACNMGHNTRVRHVTKKQVGTGTCALAESEERRQSKGCNTQACSTSPPLACASKVDIIIAVDSSGSIGADDFAKVKTWVQGIANRVTLSDTAANLGILQFADTAKEVSPLNADAGTPTTVTSMAWLKGSTNTQEALVQARHAFQEGREGAPSVLVLITDGLPSRMYFADLEAKRLKELNVRIVVVATQAGKDSLRLRKWASWPLRENFMNVKSYKGLDDALATNLLANICRNLA